MKKKEIAVKFKSGIQFGTMANSALCNGWKPVPLTSNILAWNSTVCLVFDNEGEPPGEFRAERIENVERMKIEVVCQRELFERFPSFNHLMKIRKHCTGCGGNDCGESTGKK